MSLPKSINLALVASMACFNSGSALALQAQTAPASQPAGHDICKPPTVPLDPRIDSSKITKVDPAPLPAQVMLPVPPQHRVAQDAAAVPISKEHFDKARAAVDRGLAFLRTAQAPDGSWMSHIKAAPTGDPNSPSPVAVAVTALAVKAFVQSESGAMSKPELVRAASFVTSAQREDGRFEGGSLSNYVTSAAVSALATIDKRDFHDNIQSGIKWLQSNQWDQSEGLACEQDWFGGAGYGNSGRPDMSNTSFMADALYDAGMSPDEPAFQRALEFVSRTQNLRQTNKSSWAGNDGGFVYTPANGGESMASEAAGEGRMGEKLPEGSPRSLRSYGSMTYAGFKSMFYAGLDPNDVRVRACFDWISNHFTFDENPGVGQQGLYYYYHTMARALFVAQQATVTDAGGQSHNWREELIDAIIKRQRDDGSWKNEADRWLEGEPAMATIDAVLALQEAIKPVVR